MKENLSSSGSSTISSSSYSSQNTEASEPSLTRCADCLLPAFPAGRGPRHGHGRNDPHRPGARILSGHELSVSQNGLSLEIFGQDADVDEVWSFVERAVQKVSPAQMGGVATQFQHVIPIDLDYAEAKAAAAASFLEPLAGEI